MSDKQCIYTKESSDSFGTNWDTQCGSNVRCEAPIEVGMWSDPLPNEEWEFCPYCGGKIVLNTGGIK